MEVYTTFNTSPSPIMVNLLRLGLNIILKENYFIAPCGTIYHQKRGIAMGTPIAPLIANIYMFALEKALLDPLSIKPLLYRRYIDDIIMIIKREDKQGIEPYLSEITRNIPSIRFTTKDSAKQIEFLDLLIFKGRRFLDRNIFDIKTYEKELNKYLYIPRSSGHPIALKKSFIKAETIRHARNCSDILDFNNQIEKFKSRLMARGYKSLFIDKILVEVDYKDRENYIAGIERQRVNNIYFPVTYSESLDRQKLSEDLNKQLELFKVQDESWRNVDHIVLSLKSRKNTGRIISEFYQKARYTHLDTIETNLKSFHNFMRTSSQGQVQRVRRHRSRNINGPIDMSNQLEINFPVVINTPMTLEIQMATTPQLPTAVYENPSDSSDAEEGNQIEEGSLAVMEVGDSLPYRVDIHPNPTEDELAWTTLYPTIARQPKLTWSQVRSRDMVINTQTGNRHQNVRLNSLRTNTGIVSHWTPSNVLTEELPIPIEHRHEPTSIRPHRVHGQPFVEIGRIPSLPEHRMATNSRRPHVIIQRVPQTPHMTRIRRPVDRENEPSPRRYRQTRPTIKLDQTTMLSNWRICGSRQDSLDSEVRREHRTLAVELGIDPRYIPYMSEKERRALREGRLVLQTPYPILPRETETNYE